MNRIVALLAHYERLTTLRNHDEFPRTFAFQVFDLVHMMDFIGFAVRRAAQFAHVRFQPLFEGRSRITIGNCRIADNIRGIRRFLTLGVLYKVAAFASRLCFIRDAPISFAVFEHGDNFGNGAFMLRRKRFQATVFHEVGQITQLVKVAGNPIVITDSPQFGVVSGDNLQIRKAQKGCAVDGEKRPVFLLYRNSSGENEIVDFIVKGYG